MSNTLGALHAGFQLFAQATPRPSPTSAGATTASLFSTLWLDFVIAALFGGVGGIGYGLLQDKGLQLPRLYKDKAFRFLDLGFVASIAVGAIAALITYSINHPDSIAQLIGTAVIAGVGGTGILKAYINGQAARSEADHADQLGALATQAASENDTSSLKGMIDATEQAHSNTRQRLGVVWEGRTIT